MEKYKCPPVLFMVFNRPMQSVAVFDVIKKVKPEKLYIAADGPRANNKNDYLLCEKVRRDIVDMIDWDCELKTLFREHNLGSGDAIVGAIDWFFDNVEYGIILEDDCLPSISFFAFCEQMLNNYYDDQRIAAICGTNILKEWCGTEYSYIFSYYGGNWGWATWRRAWKNNKYNKEVYKDHKYRKYIEYVLADKRQAEGVLRWVDEILLKMSDVWDIQWFCSRLLSSGMTIVPAKNLIQNIGFGLDATHTKKKSVFSDLPLYEINIPCIVNPIVVVDREFDKDNARIYGFLGIKARIKRNIKRVLMLIRILRRK